MGREDAPRRLRRKTTFIFLASLHPAEAAGAHRPSPRAPSRWRKSCQDITDQIRDYPNKCHPACLIYMWSHYILAHPQFSVTMIARRGGRWMRNLGGKGFFRGHPVSFRKGRRDRRPAEKPRLKPACSREEPPPWSPKESLSPPGPRPHTKLGVGLSLHLIDSRAAL